MSVGLPEDLKEWYALACPTEGIRLDARTLELLDTDNDGRIRADELKAAFAFLAAKGVSCETLDSPMAADRQRLAEVQAKAADLEKLEPSELERAAYAAWEAAGKSSEVLCCGAATAEAYAAFSAVEKVIDGFFALPDDLPLVTEEPDVVLPLAERLNPRFAPAIADFATKCVTPLCGAREKLSRQDWNVLKAAFKPYRAWRASRPVTNADAHAALADEERLLRYRLYLGRFWANYVTMDDLYAGRDAMFKLGVLRMDGKELTLCFHVASEAEHAALVKPSNCCVIYVKLTRHAEETRTICAVVTAGTTNGLYVGRNGVFQDRDGLDWSATITQVVLAPVSLAEAFWQPWRKVGETFGAMVSKFLSSQEKKAVGEVQSGTALASSVAAIGVGIGMVGGAFAALLSAIRGLHPWWMFFVALAAVVLCVSVPNMVLVWFKLRRRDLAPVLNASGWAINRPMRFSMRLAAKFTRVRGVFG